MKRPVNGLPVAAILLGLRFVLVGLGLTMAGPVLADDASLGRVGDGVQPLRQADVQMLAEEVRVKVYPERSVVEATFTFLNRGPTVDLLVGFPQALEQADPERAEFSDDTALHDFRAWVGGREAPVQLEKAATGGQGAQAGETVLPESGSHALPPYPAWYTFSVSLASGEKVEVRNTYWVKNTSWSNGEVEAGYILQSGATWAGRIGRGRVELVLEGIEPYQVIGARPGNWRLEKENTYVWEFADWEPDQDITMHFSNRPGPAFYLSVRPEIEALFRDSRYAESLPLLEQALRDASLAEGERQVLLFRRGVALQELGRLQEARALWEANLDLPWLAGQRGEEATREALPGGQSEPPGAYRLAGGPAAYYHLARVYRQQGDLEALSLLYHQVVARQMGLPLQRWLELYLPASERVRPAPPVVAKTEIELDHIFAKGRPLIAVELADPDGDLWQWSLRAWTVSGGTEAVLAEQREEVWYGETYSKQARVPLPPQPPGTVIYYQVSARDGAGHVAQSGVQVWTLPSAEEMWGNPLGEVEVEGLVAAVAGPEGTHYELGGYYLAPFSGLETAAGYLLRVRGTVTDRAVHGLKVLQIKDVEVLDKGEGAAGKGKPLPSPPVDGPAKAAPGPAAPAGGQPAGAVAFPRQEVLIGNLAATGANLRLELADGRRIEFSAPKPLDDAATGGLALVTGSWPEEGTFVAERVLPLSGDLAGRRAELRPYLNLVPGVRLFLDNRGMEHSGTLEQAHTAFRSPPFMLNDTTFVDALELTEILDLSLGYHPGSRVITWEGRGRPLKLAIGQSGYSAYQGPGQPWASVLRYDGKLYVPLRFVLEHYGYQVEYDPGQNLIRAGAPFAVDAPVETLGG